MLFRSTGGVHGFPGLIDALSAFPKPLICAVNGICCGAGLDLVTTGDIAIASEEVSLNRLFPGRALNTSEPAPGTYDTWQRSISA